MQKVILRKKNIEDFSHDEHDPLDNTLKSSWLHEEDIPIEPNYKNTWRYFIVQVKTQKEYGEYKDLQEAYDICKLYGKGFRVRKYEPTLDEVLRLDKINRTERRFQSGFGG